MYVSVLGGDEEKKSVMQGLKNANGFIRHLIAERINLRFTPELIFKLDESAEYAIRMDQLMNQISGGRKENDADESGE